MTRRPLDRSTAPLFAAAIFAGATLLFACQPLVARMTLPLLGGAPSVWIVCSLCFQTILLAGYGYAHFVGTRLPMRVQIVLQLVLLSAVFLVMPVAVDERAAARLPAGDPTVGLLLLLLRTIGLPFFVLSTSSPLLQRWFAEVGERDPYHLYAASNAGSMLALLGYPLAVEPLLSVRAQSRGLHVAFAFYVLLVVACVAVLARGRRRAPSEPETTPAPPQVRISVSGTSAAAPVSTAADRWRERFAWVALSFAPSSLLLGTTEYVTTEIASVPLLWMLPLALYLLSFIFAFAKRQLIPQAMWSRALVLLALVVTWSTIARIHHAQILLAATHMLLLLVGSVVCHRVLALRRPHVSRLTEFYLLLSIGGVLGGMFNGLVAPFVFHDLFEYPIAIGLVCLGRALLESRAERRAPVTILNLVFAVIVGGFLSVAMASNGNAGALLWANRGFFGVLKVTRDARAQRLLSGQVMHGMQSLDPAEARVPLAYFHPSGPAGDVLGPLPEPGVKLPSRRVGVIGLGVGSLAAYARPGDAWTFFEVNPAVVDVARRYFTYVSSAEERARVSIEIGDARLRLRDGDAARFDVLVVDAYSSDAIPVHLVTREALAVYRHALRPGGVLLVHVTNEHVRLAPVFGALARAAGMAAVERHDGARDDTGKVASHWVVLTDSRAELDGLLRSKLEWRPLAAPERRSVWTDDYADVLGALRF